jgi:hypothetical protein
LSCAYSGTEYGRGTHSFHRQGFCLLTDPRPRRLCFSVLDVPSPWVSTLLSRNQVHYTLNTRFSHVLLSFPLPAMSMNCMSYFTACTWLYDTFLVLQDSVVSGRAGVEDFILSFLVPAAVEVALLKQVLPSIHTLRALRGSRTQQVRTTTSLTPIKVKRTKYFYNSYTCIALFLRILHRHSPT